MSNEALRSAQDVLLSQLSQAAGPMDPSELLAAAAKAPQPLAAEHLRIALWSLLSRGEIVRCADNTLTRREPVTA